MDTLHCCSHQGSRPQVFSEMDVNTAARVKSLESLFHRQDQNPPLSAISIPFGPAYEKLGHRKSSDSAALEPPLYHLSCENFSKPHRVLPLIRNLSSLTVRTALLSSVGQSHEAFYDALTQQDSRLERRPSRRLQEKRARPWSTDGLCCLADHARIRASAALCDSA